MRPALTDDEIEQYRKEGFLVCERVVPGDLIDAARDALPSLIDEPGPHRFLETDGSTVRALYGLHQRGGVWDALARDRTLLGAATVLLDGPVYLFQWKINPKASDVGEKWEWHRDFDFWCLEDGVPGPAMVTAALFLDDVTPENGPMIVIPGSHLDKVELDEAKPETGEEGWEALVSSALKYTVAEDEITAHTSESGARAICGPRGTVLFFHPNLIHSSSANTSSDRRALGFLTYNRTSNAPDAPRRPEFFVNHDTQAISVSQ